MSRIICQKVLLAPSTCAKYSRLICARRLSLKPLNADLPITKKCQPFDFKCQSVATDDGAWKISMLKNTSITPFFCDTPMTVYEVMRYGKKIGGTDMLGKRIKVGDQLVWKWITYDEGITISDYISQALRKVGVAIGDQNRIGIYSNNRPEWFLTDMATHNFSNVTVPLYDTITIEDMCYILNLAELSVVFVDVNKKTETLLKEKSAGKIDILKHIIQYDSVDNELLKKAEKAGVKLWSYDDFVKMGEKCAKENPQPHVVPKPETVATISFTSGTTGRPKGVILTHLNLCSTLAISRDFQFRGPGIDTYLSYLPTAHIFERIASLIGFLHGNKVGVFRGDPQLLVDDVQSLKPTVLATVPRVIDKIKKAVMRQVSDRPLAKTALKYAIAYKLLHFRITGKATRKTLVDKLILAKVQALLGPNLRYLVVGAAKCDVNTLEFMRGAFGIYVVEGYGQTETSGPATMQVVGDSSLGNSGPPIPSCQMKMVDVPELGYYSDKNGGELWFKGYNITSGYFRNPKATDEAITPDGYLKTGDIGRFTPEGSVEIVDRIKNVFKLPQGKFVAPEKIEAVYTTSRFVQQIYVHGDLTKPWLLAVVVPDPGHLASYAKHKFGIEGKSFEELCNDERLTEAVTRHLIALTKSHNMPRYEGIYGVHLTPTIFSAENNLTTPTLKNKRANLAKHFKKQLDAIYEKLEATENKL